jgi:hypothetical protein
MGGVRSTTERLAELCAAHPQRTLGVWGLALLTALVLVATTLHGLSSSYHFVGKPESARAAAVIDRAFPASSGSHVAGDSADILVVHSTALRADQPAYRAFVASESVRLTV